ncbi:MAG: hypothetical protein JST01_04525 [Cyanobacteria bacterium SZAS TMP-1]|nr:hypothetical protein [Cyanobacteria bacterium SZAS TMP-1]
MNSDKSMRLTLSALVAVLLSALSFDHSAARAQSFNGAGAMNPSSPTGWGPNPNTYSGSGVMGGFNPGFGLGVQSMPMPYGMPYGDSRMPSALGTLNGRPVVYPFGVPNIAPVPVGNGIYSFSGGGISANMWQGPSGYYYPWATRNPIYSQIIYVDQSGPSPQTVAQLPPLSMQFSDMSQYLDDAKKNKKISDPDYNSLKLRLKDIQSKERSYRIQGGGQLSGDVEAEIRQNLTDFSREMTNRIQL